MRWARPALTEATPWKPQSLAPFGEFAWKRLTAGVPPAEAATSKHTVPRFSRVRPAQRKSCAARQDSSAVGGAGATAGSRRRQYRAPVIAFPPPRLARLPGRALSVV